jgi:cell wall-associated NlpC family hydrolase
MRFAPLAVLAGSALALALALAGCAGPRAGTGASRGARAYVSPLAPEGPVGPRAAAAIGFAQAQVGKRYCWGGTGPGCFDCSGLVQAAWRWGGVALPRTSAAQGRALHDVPVDRVRPGDILWWPGHVGLYVGGGEMIDAYHSGAGVVRRRAARPERVLRVEQSS